MGWNGLKLNLSLDDKNISSQMMSLENRLTKTAKTAENLTAKMRELASTKIPTEDYAEYQRQLELSRKKAIELTKKISEGGSSKQLATWQSQLEEIRADISSTEKYMSQMEEEGTAFISGDQTEEYAKLKDKLQDVNAQMEVLKQKHNELEAKAKKKTFADSIKNIEKRIVKLATRVFIFSQITKAFRAMVTAMQEGLKDLSQYSSEYNQNMSDLKSRTTELKYNLASMAEPILNAIIPAFTTLVGWINTAVEAITKFLSALSGKSTYTKATKQVINYANSVKDATKAQQGALASFDDLNVLSQSSSSDTSGGASSGADAFEEVEMDTAYLEMVQRVKDILEQIFPLVVLIGGAFLAWKVGTALTALMQVSPLLATILGWLSVIAGLAIAIVSYFKMWNKGVDWSGIIGYVAGVALAVGGLYALFGPFVAGLVLIGAGVAGVVLALKDMYDNGVNVQNISLLMISVIGILVGVFMAFGSSVAIVVGIIAGILLVLGSLVVLGGNGKEAIDHLKNAFKALGDFVSKIFTGDLEGAFEDLKTAGKEFYNFFMSVAEGIANGFIKMVNTIIDAINSIKFGPIPDWVPIIGGQTFNLNIPNWNAHVELPRLANGGITTGSTLAQIGEAGREAVLPLENNTGWMEDLARQMVDFMQGSASNTVVLTIDGKEFARTELPYINSENSRIGLSLAKA